MPMIRLRAVTRPCLLSLALLGSAIAQDQQPAPPQSQELAELRAAIENQTRQMEALTKQLAELTQRLSPGSTPAAAPASAQQEEPAKTPESPKAELATPESSGKHTVAKGETLTSIAKRYNIPVAELQKANKIENDRMLQIGRVLNIPLPQNKTQEPPKAQKENP